MPMELSTADAKGTRKWIYPVLARGVWHRRRRLLAYGLIAWLLVAPWLKISGKQAIFFDILHGRIYFLGGTFRIHETLVFLSFILFLFSSFLLLTAVLGRVFCGWACPQTVFMEFVFRPIERFFEGMGFKQKIFLKNDLAERLPAFILKWFLFILVAVILGNTFVAYFMGSHRLIPMILEGPSQNLGPFIFMLISSLIILFQFGWFREQVCLFVCPYGRLQSVLLDSDSLVVAYDPHRGEPRGKPGQTTGDCVDCKMCVHVCPTGIDIRNGLQMECVQCTQCMDACDRVMETLHRTPRLIRYQIGKIWRPRLFFYSLILLAAAISLIGFTSSRKNFSASIHRESTRELFSMDADGFIVNPVRVHLTNLSDKELHIRFIPGAPSNLEIISPEGDPVLRPEEKSTVYLLLRLSPKNFENLSGKIDVNFQAVDQTGVSHLFKVRMLGPVL